MNDWNLTETASTYGGGTQFHISSLYDRAEFRWLDTPAKATVVSGNSCGDMSPFGVVSIPVNDTGYRTLFTGPASTCFYMRGRTAAGSGSMVNHDGRSRR